VKLIHRILILNSLFEGGRLIVGATSVTYMLSAGISLSSIAVLKIFQAITLIIFELPTGLFADFFGRKKSLLIAVVFSILGFILNFLGKSFLCFAVAEIFYAISLSFWSGAYEAYAIEQAQLSHQDLDHFFYKDQMTKNLSILVLGFLGACLGSLNLKWPYLASIFAFCALAIIIYTLPETSVFNKFDLSNLIDLNSFSQKMISHFKIVKSHLNVFVNLKYFFLAQFGIQFIIQPMYHYWQPFFKFINPHATSINLGIIFALFCGSSVLFGFLGTLASQHGKFKTKYHCWSLFFVFSILFFLISLFQNFVGVIILFSLTQGILSLGRSNFISHFNKNIQNSHRAITLSSLSFFSRFGSAVSLHYLSNFDKVKSIYSSYSIITFIFIIISGLFIYKNQLLKIFKLRSVSYGHNS
jgi:MFS family permease